MSTGGPTASASERVQGESSRALATTPERAGAELHRFLVQLLELQAQLVGALAGVIYLSGSETRQAGLAARWPADDASGAESLAQVFQPSALRRLEQIGQSTCRVASERGPGEAASVERIDLSASGLYGSHPTHAVIATPLVAAGRVEGASVLVLGPQSGVSHEEALERVALTTARLDAFLWKQQAFGEASQKAMLRETLELLDASQQGSDAKTMGSLMCHELQRRFGCTRVSIGLISGPAAGLRLAAISGSESIDRRGPAAEALESAMEECALQDIELLYPPEEGDAPETARVLRAHEQLSQKFGPSAILSLPLRVEGDLVGVVVLEREAQDPFPPGAIPLLRLVAEYIGPALWTRRLADRGVLAVTRDRTRQLGAALVGPRYTGMKLLGLLGLALVLAASFVPIPDRVSAEAEVQASVSRTIVPPFTGFLDEVMVRPGDNVTRGDVLARMSTIELDARLDELLSRRVRLVTERDQAQTRGASAEVARLAASIREVDAQIDTVRARIADATIVSPIAGVVSRGDLEDFVGARVDPTQALIEVVGPERIVAIEVDERDIGGIERGQTGTLSSRARPGDRIPIEVTRINPLAEPVRGANVYMVEARIGREVAWLRPGETGIARLDAGSTTAMSELLGPIIDELRLRLWW